MSPEAYVVIEHRLKDGPADGPPVSPAVGPADASALHIDPESTQVLGVFGTAQEAVRWVLKTFEETAGARRHFADAEKLALFNVLVATDPFIENVYKPIVIPLMTGKVMQILAGRMLGGLALRVDRKPGS
jgi:hypothetical protein